MSQSVLVFTYFRASNDEGALPENFDCDGVMAARTAAEIALTRDDLASWSVEDLGKCLSTFGTMNWNRNMKTDVWDILKSNFVVIS